MLLLRRTVVAKVQRKYEWGFVIEKHPRNACIKCTYS